MADTTVLTVSGNDFEQLIKNSHVPVLMYFWAEWCLPCKVVSPLIDDFAAEYEGKLLFAKLDADKNQDILKQYKVFSIPTLIIFRNGVEIERKVGSKNKIELQKVFQRYL